MVAWICPACRRGFGRVGQSHDCAPGMTEDEYFRTGPPFERPVYDAVMAHVASLGPVFVEYLSVGMFIKKTGRWIQLRPMTKWAALWFPMPRRIDDPRIARKPMGAGATWFHVVNLRAAEDVDDQVRSWLTESWLATP